MILQVTPTNSLAHQIAFGLNNLFGVLLSSLSSGKGINSFFPETLTQHILTLISVGLKQECYIYKC